eukprot:gene10521-21946_t
MDELNHIEDQLSDDDPGELESPFAEKVIAEEQIKARTLTALIRARSTPDLATNETSDNQKDIRLTLFEAAEPYPHPKDFQRVVITETGDALDDDTVLACKSIKKCLNLRNKWISSHPCPPQDHIYVDVKDKVELSHLERKQFRRRSECEYDIFRRPVPVSTNKFRFEMHRGVMCIYDTLIETTTATSMDSDTGNPSNATICDNDSELAVSQVSTPIITTSTSTPPVNVFPVPPFEEFVEDFVFVSHAVHTGHNKTFAYKRLELLAAKFSLHVLLNETREADAQKSDFYNIRKVDTHVHHSACMNQKHLLRFIKHKLKCNPEEVVIFRDGRFLTLGEVFQSLHIT